MKEITNSFYKPVPSLNLIETKSLLSTFDTRIIVLQPLNVFILVFDLINTKKIPLISKSIGYCKTISIIYCNVIYVKENYNNSPSTILISHF